MTSALLGTFSQPLSARGLGREDSHRRLPNVMRKSPRGQYQPLPTSEEPPAQKTRRKWRSLDVDLTPEARMSPWNFVERGWFQSIGALATIVNMMFLVMETNDPTLKPRLMNPNKALLCFYAFELLARAFYFRRFFFCGPRLLVAFNTLDLLVVTGGAVDLWVVPVLPAKIVYHLQAPLGMLKGLRVVRILNIIRIVLESDLSWTEEPGFQSFIGSVIVVNAVLMGMETDISWTGWVYIEQVFLLIYVFELTVLIMRFGKQFLSCSNPDIGWNTLDSVIVLSSVVDSWLIPGLQLMLKVLQGTGKHAGKEGLHKTRPSDSLRQAMMLMRMLRLMRILRLVKLVKSVKPLFILVTGVLAALQGVFWVLVLTIVTLYAMGLMATRLIGHKMVFPDGVDVGEDILVPFRTVPDSMFTLFRVMSGASSDDELLAIDELMRALPTIKFAFVFFMVTSSWTLLSILTAVVSENMISTTNQQEDEMRIIQFEEERAEHIRCLQLLFNTMDTSQDGLVDREELATFLCTGKNAQETARLCKVPRRHIIEVLNTITAEGTVVSMRDFVEALVDVANPVTHKSMLVLDARLSRLQATQEALLDAFHEQAKRRAAGDGTSGRAAPAASEPVELQMPVRARRASWHGGVFPSVFQPKRILERVPTPPPDSPSEPLQSCVGNDSHRSTVAGQRTPNGEEEDPRDACSEKLADPAPGEDAPPQVRSAYAFDGEEDSWQQFLLWRERRRSAEAFDSTAAASVLWEHLGADAASVRGPQEVAAASVEVDACAMHVAGEVAPTAAAPPAAPASAAAASTAATPVLAAPAEWATRWPSSGPSTPRSTVRPPCHSPDGATPSKPSRPAAATAEDLLVRQEAFAQTMEAALSRLLDRELQVGEALAALHRSVEGVSRGQELLLQRQEASEKRQDDSRQRLLARLGSGTPPGGGPGELLRRHDSGSSSASASAKGSSGRRGSTPT